MKTSVSSGLRVAAWATCGLLAMGAAAGTASAVTGHHGGPGQGSPGGPGSGGPGGPGGPGRPGGHDGGILPGLVHGVGTFKVKGGYKTFKEQTGTVTDINTEALVVTSADEYAATYVISSSTKVRDNSNDSVSDIADGDSVQVIAKKVGGHYTAVVISECNGKHHEHHHSGGDS
jgi:hypothetical protein